MPPELLVAFVVRKDSVLFEEGDEQVEFAVVLHRVSRAYAAMAGASATLGAKMGSGAGTAGTGVVSK